jgi:uncharacterized membrane-anchored protein
MAKLTAWLVTLIGVLLILPALNVVLPAWINTWIIPLAVLVVGVSKLVRNYSKKKK